MNFYERAGMAHPKLARGQVWCRTCGATEKVNSADCLRSGWPTCCGETMTIDSPAERLAATELREESKA